MNTFLRLLAVAIAAAVEWWRADRTRQAKVAARKEALDDVRINDLERSIEITDAAADVRRVRRDAADTETGKFRD